MVNITSKVTSGNAYIGGIVGYSGTGAQNISNNFYIGNIYVAGNSVGYVNRIFGENSGTNSYKNYAYKDQLINGEISTNALGTTKLLSYQEAFQLNTYTSLLGYTNNYTYKIKREGTDFDLLANEYLPQLNNTNGNVLLNQKLIAIDNDLKLDSISSTPSSDKTRVTVVMKFENRNNLNLTKVKIENNDMEVVEGSWQTSKDSNGLTVVTFVATPNRAYDSYKIESIYYERNGQEVEKEIITKIKVELYKGISNAKEWNEFFSGEGRNSEGQNVKITGNIDFNTVSNIETNVVIGKLEADSMKTISNINISGINSYSGFIKEIKTSLKNITFENVKIDGKSSYFGIISILRGTANNCKFNNINISSTGDFIGAVSRNIAGSFNNITLSKANITGRSYVGSLCGQASSLGSSSGIEGTYISINGSGNCNGGLFGYSDGRVSNISAYQYSKEGKKSGDTETAYLVKGSQYVGGNIGQYGGGGNTASGLTTTNSKIQGTNFVSGNIGYGSGNANTLTSANNTISGSGNYIGGNVGYHGWSCSSLVSSNNSITGNAYVGGNSGGCGYANERGFTAENNSINGNNYVGGCTGIGDSYYSYIDSLRSKGSNQQISGISHVGGVVGRTVGRTRNVKAEDCVVTATGNYVGGVIGSSEYSTTSISASNNSNYAVAGANAKNVTVNGSMNYVGGIIGYQVGTISGAVLENSLVTAKGSYVGGIAGLYTGYTGRSASSIASSNFFLWHSYASNSTIKGSGSVGGIAGKFIYGNIQYCYVGNTEVTADSNGAGGIVGYFDNSKLSNIQYKATIKYNFVANVQDDKIIAGSNSVGGLIGIIATKLNYDEDIEKYNNVECNLISTDIVSSGSYIDMGIGSVAGSELGTIQSQYMNNIYVYNCSTLNGTQVGGITEEKENYEMVSSAELSTNIYTKNEKILDEEEKVIGNKGLNFGNGRYDYSNGYFPTLKQNYSASIYWGSGDLNIIQNKIPIPNRTPEFSEDTVSLNDVNIDELAVMSLLQDEELPDISVYAVDIDKINIEFRNQTKDTKFKITSNEKVILEPTNIEKQVYTLKYDFNSPLEITVFNTSYSYKKQIEPEDARNVLSIVDDEYFYLTDDTLHSSKRTIDGNYINLYKEEAIDKDGNIYNIKSMSKIGSTDKEIKVLDEETPISESKANGATIKNFAHCSKVIQSDNSYVYKEQQIFVKNGYMYVIDGKTSNKNGLAIIDYFNNKQYETILGEDGSMHDLLTEIKYPSGFKNSEIVSMTSNVDNNNNVVLVYYSNGRVYGFNYITGEEVYENNVKDEKVDLASYIMSNLSLRKVSYNINKSNYTATEELASKLDKVSIDEATKKIKGNNNENTEVNITISDGQSDSNISKENSKIQSQNESNDNKNNILNTSSKNNDNIDNKYVTAYDAGTKSYVVYSTDDLIQGKASKTQTENEKINQNDDLISFYTNLSTSSSKMKNAGIIIIASIVGSICIILAILYKKTNR